VLHLKKVVCGPLNVLADLVAVRRTVQKGSQDEHVQRALEKARARLLCLFHHGRQSTLNLATMVDIRLSLVKECPGRWISKGPTSDIIIP
jgi:hypothetical protein